MLPKVIIVLVLWSMLSSVWVLASTVKDDEDVIFFRTHGYFDPAGEWILPIHGWIFEPEADSIWRSVIVDGVIANLGLSSQATGDQLLRKRVRYFLFDNEEGKEFAVRINGLTFEAEESEDNGHFSVLARLTPENLGEYPANHWVTFELASEKESERQFKGMVRLIHPRGISVISDIDDTIKISEVTDRKQLLANTFLREFRPVPGMAEFYRRLAQSGAPFHYVSCSPWQLYPTLVEFMDNEGFPLGSFHLKPFRAKDQTFFNLFRSPEASKIRTIESIMKLYPERKFILMGDSGEKDPEIYGEIAREHPGQILHIVIRALEPGRDDKRYQVFFQDVERRRWTVFHEAEELTEFQLHR